MSDLSLSQDEIDALLMSGGPTMAKPPKSLSQHEASLFRNILNDASSSQGAAVMGMMDGKDVTFSLTSLELNNRDGFLDQLSKDQDVVELRVDFSGEISGSHGIYLSSNDAGELITPILGQQEIEMNGATINALEEVASQMSAALVNQLSAQSGKSINPSPASGNKQPKAMISTPDDDLVTAVWSVSISGKTIKLVEFFSYPFVQKLVGPEKKSASAQPAQGNTQPEQNMGNPQQGYNPQMMGGYPPQMMGQMPMMGGMPPGQMAFYPNVQGVQFPNLAGGIGIKDQGNIGLLMDVMMEVTVELGRARRQIKEILGMGEGTIIALDKLAGEAVDILVNHKLIAKGEVVVIEENFGVRVTEIVTTIDKNADN